MKPSLAPFIWLVIVFLFAVLFLAAGYISVSPALAATPVTCTASPSQVTLGGKVVIACSGFDANTIVNSYIVDQTGFSEWGHDDYTACFMNGQGLSGQSGKTDKSGGVTFIWYTQNGVNSCPRVNYNGYANELGTYTVVVQELAPGNQIKFKGIAQVTLASTAAPQSRATLAPNESSVPVFGTISFTGSGFVPFEAVNIWFNRPADCSGLGSTFWSAVGAFDPVRWGFMSGVRGPDTAIADASGSFTVTYTFGDRRHDEMPCTGDWSITARALGSGRGAIASFSVAGDTVANNVTVSTTETSVPANGQMYDCGKFGCGIGVHVNGSGFPPGAVVNCWFTRPDGTTYVGYRVGPGVARFTANAVGSFSGLTLTYSSENGFQGEQLGRWAVTCGTPDGKFSGTGWFNVFGLIDP